jgi:hypothetical protein
MASISWSTSKHEQLHLFSPMRVHFITFISDRNTFYQGINHICNLLYIVVLYMFIYTPVALFTKIPTIKNCRKCKTKIKKSFTKILTIILSVKIVLTLRVKLPCPKCKILIVREILVLSFIVSEKNRKKMDDVLALRLENKRAIHR